MIFYLVSEFYSNVNLVKVGLYLFFILGLVFY